MQVGAKKGQLTVLRRGVTALLAFALSLEGRAGDRDRPAAGGGPLWYCA